MANLDLPCGFRPKGVPLRVNKYVAGGVVYPGDAVGMDSTGRIVAAAAGGVLCGVALTYASAAAADILVADHPDQLFIAQGSSTQVDAQTDIGNMMDILATAGSSTYKLSRHEVDTSTLGTGTAQVLLLGIVDSPNNALGDNVDIIVRINEHLFGSSVAGI